jgi:WhiB family redox-sensing transcriptional regulator
MTTALTPTAHTPAIARPFASFRLRADVRLFHTDQHLACRQDPELFFDARRRHRAIKRCAECPFRGRCGYNAVATGATHGVWGGVILPGDYPQELKPLYAILTAQFEQRRRGEIGDVPVAPLPQLSDDETDDDELDDDDPLIFPAGAA